MQASPPDRLDLAARRRELAADVDDAGPAPRSTLRAVGNALTSGLLGRMLRRERLTLRLAAEVRRSADRLAWHLRALLAARRRELAADVDRGHRPTLGEAQAPSPGRLASSSPLRPGAPPLPAFGR